MAQDHDRRTVTAFRCRICGGESAEVVIEGASDRLHGLGGEFDYVRCHGCRLMQIRVTPPDLWSRHYRNYGRHARESRLYELGRRLTTGACYLWADGPGRVLDIGCGNGWYLKDLEARGWSGTGYEPDPAQARAVTDMTGIPVHSQPAAIPDAGFDLVTMNFVLEHSEDPIGLLDMAARSCRPGGRVALSLPDPESAEARMFGERWFHLDAPRHLVLPTRDQAVALVAGAGLTVESIRSLPASTGFAGSLSYRLVGRFNPILWYAFTPLGMVFCRAVPDGLFMVIASKPA